MASQDAVTRETQIRGDPVWSAARLLSPFCFRSAAIESLVRGAGGERIQLTRAAPPLALRPGNRL